MAVIFYNKKYTETLAVMLNRFRSEYPKFIDSKITYAGRLDPMANGLMILLTDEDVHQKEEYLNRDKIYEVDFIFGAETDTLDILGLVRGNFIQTDFSIEQLKEQLSKLKKITSQKYPHYSSKTVKGKPLWQWAKEGQLDTISIPTRDIQVYSVKYLGKRDISITDFRKNISKDINQVQGDFRQAEIIRSWSNFFKNYKNQDITIHRLRLHVSSGSYVRSLVCELGKLLNSSAVSVRISRIQIGEDILT